MGIAHVPEGRAILPHMSVLEDLELGAYRRHYGREKRSTCVAYVTEVRAFPVGAGSPC
ncbi:MAG TPA: hypothetical protein VFX49_17525 [Chloroflexota bacterium]|nr:hypothetical protein [Chloroflexota bacterium]